MHTSTQAAPQPAASVTNSSSPNSLQVDAEHFEQLNINMNSEITLVKPQQSYGAMNSTPQWKIYDLYDMW